jgi:hypothetical protein
MSHLNSTTTTTTSSINISTTSTTSTTSTSVDVCSNSAPGFFTTKKPCSIDPIVLIFEKMAQSASNAAYSGNTYEAAISRILDKGMVEDSCEYCCPDCGNLYIFASAETFINFGDEMGWTESSNVPA